MKKKNSLPVESTPWRSFPVSQVQDTILNFVHFSAKIINSNTPPMGVRLADAEALDLPYLSLRTVGPSKIPLDYTRNAGATATIAKFLDAVSQGTAQTLFTDAPDADIAVYRDCLAAATSHHEVGAGMVSKRLRQIIVQDGNGANVALTPLASSGFVALMERRIELEIEAADSKAYRYRARAVLGIGGANPQNVGRFVRTMRRPLWFAAPTENTALRKALAIHYRGISLAVPAVLLMEYDHWRQEMLEQHGGVIPGTAKTIDIETGYLERMVQSLRQRAASARSLLRDHLDHLPGGRLVSPAVSADIRALLDPEQRYAGWNRDLARRLHVGILEQKIRIDGKLRNIGVGLVESGRWLNIIEEALK